MTGDRIELFGTMRHRTKVSVDDNNNFNYCFTQSYFCNLFKVINFLAISIVWRGIGIELRSGIVRVVKVNKILLLFITVI
ncbi:hypothetical protein DERF_002916 [Dermatophagoides farinae]|uniref:Uncharacterized protein n=1 Tax=Dermatophagoides farinae TaxID=6954 RepID=A0A922IGT9_DERFA|nr:hypothetical protein DERF_002916 [Dermatophagoides farinae]